MTPDDLPPERSAAPPARFAIFVAASWNYACHLTALLNSIERQGLAQRCDLTVHLLCFDFPAAYIEAACSRLRYPIVCHEGRREDFPQQDGLTRNRFYKIARFRRLADVAASYDVTCLLDADMFLVSPELVNLFRLVDETRLLIGCNEAFKWRVCDPRSDSRLYHMDGKPLFESPVVLRKMHCSVPVLFRHGAWREVLAYYDRLVWTGSERKGGRDVPIGDIFAWNLAVQALGRQDDVVLLPMEVMCQVHHTNVYERTRIVEEGGRWRTVAGDIVYSIHGRVCEPGWIDGHREAHARLKGVARWDLVEASLRRIQREWHDLSFGGALRLDEFVKPHPAWPSFPERS